MKRRIISSILVVVMLVLSLVSCGYSYTKDDLGEYMTFDKTAFEEALNNLEYEDGAFTTNEETRKDKIEKYIYDILVKRIDTNEKLTEGKISERDQLYYRYYVTYVNAKGETVVLYASNMNKSNTSTSIKLGDNTLTGKDAAIRDHIVALIEGGTITDIKNYIYEPDNTATKALAGMTAYINYTKNWVEKDSEGNEVSRKETHTNERVVIGDEKNFAAKALVDSTVGTALTEDTSNPLKDAEGNTYTGVKVNWIVPTINDQKELNDEIVVTYETPDAISPADSDLVIVNSKATADDKKIPAKTLLSYHINPAYYLAVEDLDAELILKELLSSLPDEEYKNEDGETDTRDRELASLKEATEELKALATKVSEYNTAKDAYDKAVEATETADAALGKLIKEDDEEAYAKAEKALADAKADEATKKEAMDAAEGEVNTKLSDVYKKVNENEATAKETIFNEYKGQVREVLIDEYNAEVKTNIAKAVWKVMLETAVIKSYPQKAVEETYDRMFEMHQAEFYTGKNSSNKTHYSEHKGVFKDYLIATMKNENNWGSKEAITDYKMAKHALWSLAEEYVGQIMVIYYVSSLYEGVTYDKSEIKDYKKDDNGYFEYYKDSQGENNLLAAYQFDALMDYLLEVEEVDGEVVYDETTGAPNYIRITKKSEQ